MMDMNSPAKDRLLVFTDLDGTLLDHGTYSFEPALPAIRALRKKAIPLIFCSSKTKVEIELLRIKLENGHPFITENGGAVYIPKGYFSQVSGCTLEDERYIIIELGTPYAQIRKVLKQIQSETYERLRGFGDFTDKEVALFCDFSEDEAKLARQREYDEPFFLEDKNILPKIEEMAVRKKLRITKGGRFFHLMGHTNKGEAVRRLKELYDTEHGPHTTIGFGDSLNDLQLLQAVDHPVLVQKSDGTYTSSIPFSNLIFADGIGPVGWCKALKGLIKILA